MKGLSGGLMILGLNMPFNLPLGKTLYKQIVPDQTPPKGAV